MPAAWRRCVISRLNASPPKTPAPVALPFWSVVPLIVPGSSASSSGATWVTCAGSVVVVASVVVDDASSSSAAAAGGRERERDGESDQSDGTHASSLPLSRAATVAQRERGPVGPLSVELRSSVAQQPSSAPIADTAAVSVAACGIVSLPPLSDVDVDLLLQVAELLAGLVGLVVDQLLAARHASS